MKKAPRRHTSNNKNGTFHNFFLPFSVRFFCSGIFFITNLIFIREADEEHGESEKNQHEKKQMDLIQS